MTRFEIVMTGLRVAWFLEALFCALNFTLLGAFAVLRRLQRRRVPFTAEMSLAIFLSSAVGMGFAVYARFWRAIEDARPIMWPVTIGIGILFVSLALYNLSTTGANERRMYGWAGIAFALWCGIAAAIIVSYR